MFPVGNVKRNKESPVFYGVVEDRAFLKTKSKKSQKVFPNS